MFNRAPTKDVFDTLADGELQPAESTESETTLQLCGNEAADARPQGNSADRDELGADGDLTSDSPQAPRSTSKRWWSGLAFAVIGATFVATAAAAGSLGWKFVQARNLESARNAALDTARTYAVALTSVDNAHIDDNFRQVLDGATGEFKDMYSQSAAQLRQLLIDNKAVSHGVVTDAAVRSATTDKAEILLFIDQSISNSVNPEPRIDRSRVVMTLQLINGHWLASKVEIT